VPEATIPLRLLLWDQPTTEQWDSVFIDGTRTVKRDGIEVQESKNWLQQDIVENALDFGGSPLEIMLNGIDNLELPGAEVVPSQEPVAVEAAQDRNENPAAGMNVPEAHGTPVVRVDDEPKEVIEAGAAAAAQAIFDQLGVK